MSYREHDTTIDGSITLWMMGKLNLQMGLNLVCRTVLLHAITYMQACEIYEQVANVLMVR